MSSGWAQPPQEKNRRKNKRSKSAGAKAGAKAGAGMKAGTKRNTGIGLAGAKGGDAAVAETLAVAERMPQSRRRYSLINRNLPVGAILGAAWLEAKQT